MSCIGEDTDAEAVERPSSSSGLFSALWLGVTCGSYQVLMKLEHSALPIWATSAAFKQLGRVGLLKVCKKDGFCGRNS